MDITNIKSILKRKRKLMIWTILKKKSKINDTPPSDVARCMTVSSLTNHDGAKT